MLDQLWRIQYNQQQLWHDWNNLSVQERQTLVKELLLHLHEEVAKLQRRMDQSRYHLLKARDPIETNNTAEAGVDIFKLLVALMQLGGVDASAFTEAFHSKTAVVAARDKWQKDDLGGVDVLLCDIDGCISKYRMTFEAWAFGQGVKTLGAHTNSPHLEDLKDKFHSSGGFCDMAWEPEAVDTLNAWRQGAENRRLVLVTARPYKRYRRIYSDTFEWCSNIQLKQDHILFEHDKAEAVRQVQPARIVAHIEDRGKHAIEVAHTGVDVLKLPFDAPEERIEHPKIRHVKNWQEIANKLGVSK